MRIQYVGRQNVIKKTILYSKKSSIDKEFSSLSSYLLATNDLISHYNYSANQQNKLAASWNCVFVFSLSIASKSVVLNGINKRTDQYQVQCGNRWKKKRQWKMYAFIATWYIFHSHTHTHTALAELATTLWNVLCDYMMWHNAKRPNARRQHQHQHRM